MKWNLLWSTAVAVATISAGSAPGATKSTPAKAQPQEDDPQAMMGSYEAQEKAAAAARAKDLSWKPSANEVGVIQVGDSKAPGALRNFCLGPDGNILACVAPPEEAKGMAARAKPSIRTYSPEGKLLKTIPIDIKATAICAADDGTIFAAGDGRLLKLDSEGKVLAAAASPVANTQIVIDKETEEMIKESAKQSKRPYQQELAQMKTMMEKRRSNVTGLATTGSDVFMAAPSTTDFSYRIYRFDRDLKNPKLVVEKLRGCCGQMDVQAHAGKLWIPHNARHAVETHDRDGKELAKFGKAGKVKPSDFGGCCEPKNLRILANGDILAAESGPPTCIKRFSADGKFKEVVAVADGSKGDCVRVTVEMNKDGSRYFLMDTTRDAIRVFKTKTAKS